MHGTATFKAGDRVRHDKRPEWGPGVIQRVEHERIGAKATQRLVIRFTNAGLKTLSSLAAPLTILRGAAQPADDTGEGIASLLDSGDDAGEAGWLGSISKRKPEDALIVLPDAATDPFATAQARLRATLDLYRFEPVDRSLIDWAVAQTGMADPLSRYTRHELEQFFERWAFARQKHLAKLLEESRHETGLVERALSAAPPAARRAVSRLNGGR